MKPEGEVLNTNYLPVTERIALVQIRLPNHHRLHRQAYPHVMPPLLRKELRHAHVS
jgi:hypothetical protein